MPNGVIQDSVTFPRALLMLRVSRDVGLRLIHTGQLQGELVDGRWFISRPSLERFLSERAVA